MKTNRVLDHKMPASETDAARHAKVKRVEYSYATSPNACRFGFAKTGCYTVELTKGITPPKAIAAYLDRDEAMRHAESLPNDWCKLWLRFNPSYKPSPVSESATTYSKT